MTSHSTFMEGQSARNLSYIIKLSCTPQSDWKPLSNPTVKLIGWLYAWSQYRSTYFFGQYLDMFYFLIVERAMFTPFSTVVSIFNSTPLTNKKPHEIFEGFCFHYNCFLAHFSWIWSFLRLKFLNNFDLFFYSIHTLGENQRDYT